MTRAPDNRTVVILDRDGTLVVDRGYLADPNGLEFLPHVPEALRLLAAYDALLIVATNQSGVGRGFFGMAEVSAINRRLQTMVRDSGAELAGIYVCPHSPAIRCSCRKPEPGMFERAATELKFSPSQACVVGDKESDVNFGRRVGAATILISPYGGSRTDCLQPSFATSNLLHAAQWIVKNMIAARRSSA